MAKYVKELCRPLGCVKKLNYAGKYVFRYNLIANYNGNLETVKSQLTFEIVDKGDGTYEVLEFGFPVAVASNIDKKDGRKVVSSEFTLYSNFMYLSVFHLMLLINAKPVRVKCDGTVIRMRGTMQFNENITFFGNINYSSIGEVDIIRIEEP